MLFLEELNVSPDFGEWLYKKNILHGPIPIPKKAFHSIVEADLGESDIIMLYENDHAILIENKIAAVAQPEQAERYILRGEKGIEANNWESYSTCIIAPENYLRTSVDAMNYQNRISYETIRDWFMSKNTSRDQYRAYIMSEAIEQNRRGYTTIPDPKVTSFWKDYWILASRNYPELGMKQPGTKPSNSTFIYLYPEILPKGYQLIHKVAHGFVDLQLANPPKKIDEYIELFSDLDIEVVQAGKSIAFRKHIERIEVQEDFLEQKQYVENAFHEALSLIRSFSEIYNRL